MYRANYRCFVEGQQEQMYLKHLEGLINQYPLKVISFNTSIGDAQSIATSYLDYDHACLFDFDFKKEQFERNIKLCNKYDKVSLKKSERRRVYSAYSNVCFDLWLLLQKKDYTAQVYSTDAYINDVR